jgi:hypothetical protein
VKAASNAGGRNPGGTTSTALTEEEFHRPGAIAARDWSDQELAHDALVSMYWDATVAARKATRAGQQWPYWAARVLEYQAEVRDRRAVRADLRAMVYGSLS